MMSSAAPNLQVTMKPVFTALYRALSCQSKRQRKVGMRAIIGAGLACVYLTLPTTSLALEFQCEVPNDTRYLRVEIPGREYLCEVSVTYKENGVREVKWYARNDTLFCSAQAYNLRDKYEEAWNYTCTTWPDSDGIDKLSPSQRQILDQRLKALIEEGSQATPKYTITAIRATASTLLDNSPGKIALQFFTDNGDFTEIIDDRAGSWTVTTTIERMASQIVGEPAVASALVHSISDDAIVEVHTRLSTDEDNQCYGNQMLTPVGSDGAVKVLTPHRFICQDGISSRSAMNETSDTDDTTTTQ